MVRLLTMEYAPRHAKRERRKWRATVDKAALVAEAARLDHEAGKLEAEKDLNEARACDYQHILSSEPYDPFSTARLHRDELLYQASLNEKNAAKLRRKLKRVLRRIERNG